MGLVGVVINGVRGIYGFVTEDYELVEKATEKGRRSMLRTLIDPLGFIDLFDVVDDIEIGDY